MKYKGMLMQPFTPGRNVSDERWRMAFGTLGPRDKMEDPEERYKDNQDEKVRKALEEQDG